jgi:hypothetical protein
LSQQLLEFVSDPTIRRNFEKLLGTLIDTGGKTLHLRFGKSTVLASSSADYTDATNIAHGMGSTPVVVIATTWQGGNTPSGILVWGIKALDATNFQIQGKAADGTLLGPSGSYQVLWLAIG